MCTRQGVEVHVTCHCHWARTFYTVFSYHHLISTHQQQLEHHTNKKMPFSLYSYLPSLVRRFTVGNWAFVLAINCRSFDMRAPNT